MELQEIRPIIIGELACIDMRGNRHSQFKDVYFSNGIANPAGTAMAHIRDRVYGDVLAEVRKVHHDSAGNETVSTEPLIYEGFAGLTCTYDTRTGTLKEFRK